MTIKSRKRKKTKQTKQKNLSKIKWTKIKHNGPLFPPKYKRLPKKVSFKYNRRRIKLNKEAEEMATLYAKMLPEKYVRKAIFNKNFMRDWRAKMTPSEKKLITSIEKCDFSDIHEFFVEKSEEKKLMSTKKKKNEKKRMEKLLEKYKWCIVDGEKQRVGNFKIEPPGLFRGRGNHPMMGSFKKRIQPEDVSINIGWHAPIPKPSIGGRWKEIVHNNTVTWLACWLDDISNSYKYVFLNHSSNLKYKNDIHKYELARKLHAHIKAIRKDYMKGMKSSCPVYLQTSIALYLLDHLALRVGNEKGNKNAETVGCCSLKKEHVKLMKDKGDRILHLNFRGKDSILYKNSFQIESDVFEAIQLLLKDKSTKMKLFDEITPVSLNKYLNSIMKGLSAKTFRTYNASKLLEAGLIRFTKAKMNDNDKVRAYEMANRNVAMLCNHRRAPLKNFDARTKRLTRLIREENKKSQKLQKDMDILRADEENKKLNKKTLIKKQKNFNFHNENLQRLIYQKEKHLLDKEIALTTAKLNYCDPRITVAWCKKHAVDINRIYSKTQIERFKWAIETTESTFKF